MRNSERARTHTAKLPLPVAALFILPTHRHPPKDGYFKGSPAAAFLKRHHAYRCCCTCTWQRRESHKGTTKSTAKSKPAGGRSTPPQPPPNPGISAPRGDVPHANEYFGCRARSSKIQQLPVFTLPPKVQKYQDVHGSPVCPAALPASVTKSIARARSRLDFWHQPCHDREESPPYRTSLIQSNCCICSLPGHFLQKKKLRLKFYFSCVAKRIASMMIFSHTSLECD